MKKKPRRFPRSEALVVAIYARVSTEKQDNENQLAQLRKFAKAQKWQLAYEYVDVESGSKADRPQFKQMFADASRRKFDLLLFWSLDRLSREGVLPTLRYLETLTSYGVNWRSYTEQFFDSCGSFRDAVIAIMATLAKQERIRRSERTKAGLERARSQGIDSRQTATAEILRCRHPMDSRRQAQEWPQSKGCGRQIWHHHLDGIEALQAPQALEKVRFQTRHPPTSIITA
jgi:DNA invertase Pin-like site-specific DNA recombinase